MGTEKIVRRETPLTPAQQSYVDEQNARDEAAAAAEVARKRTESLAEFLKSKGPTKKGFMDLSHPDP